MGNRQATITRETQETSIKVVLKIDGSSEYRIATGIRFLDHLLSQLSHHGLFDLELSATGVDQHHVAEDVAICLGQAFRQAWGEKRGIVRMSHAIVPMDDALALVAIDISGRGYCDFAGSFEKKKISDLDAELIHHFLNSFAAEAKMNVHVRLLSGADDHHKAEAVFKALGRALDAASRIDERVSARIPSTKEHIED
ncbi:MAG: imidazoleglycerol-phosphate dehydratase HisB [Chloroflexota bacterium]